MRGGCLPRTNDSGVAATQTEEDAEDDKDEDVLLCMPRPCCFEDYGGCTARGAGAGTVDPFHTAGMLGNLWRRMMLK